jgi:hypothetical protein
MTYATYQPLAIHLTLDPLTHRLLWQIVYHRRHVIHIKIIVRLTQRAVS